MEDIKSVTYYEQLHHSLDRLLAEYIENTGESVGQSSIMDLITWSSHQVIKEKLHNEQRTPNHC